MGFMNQFYFGIFGNEVTRGHFLCAIVILVVTNFHAKAQMSNVKIDCLSQFSTSQISSANDGLAILSTLTEVSISGPYGFSGNSSVRLKAGLCFEGLGPPYVCRCGDVYSANLIATSQFLETTTSYLQALPLNRSTSSTLSTTTPMQTGMIVSAVHYNCDVDTNPRLAGGSAYFLVNETLARFTSLRTWVAGTNLRVYFIGSIGLETFMTFSNQFIVNPGDFQAIKILDDPANGKGCSRCAIGTYLAGSPLQTSVALQDRFNNTIAQFCTNISSCTESTRRTVIVEFPQRRNFVAVIKAVSNQGIASYPNLTIMAASSNIRLSFTAPLIGNFGTVISVSSMPFIVTNADPFRPKPFPPNIPLVCANGSLFLPSTQPQVEIVDVFDNRVISDCYSKESICRKSGPENCNFTFGCSPSVTAQLISQSAFLIGRAISFTSISGLATFTDLGIVSSDKLCGTSSAVIRFSIQGISNTADKPVSITPGAARLNVMNQPPSVTVSDETFSTPVEVQILDCNGVVSVYSVAKLSARVNNAQVPGMLRGQTTESAQSGIFIFTNLNIYVPAKQVSLRFDYIGVTDLQPAISTTFDVYAPPTGLKILSQPSATDPTQPTTAGDVFWLQPQVQLQPALPTTRSVTAIIVPGWDPGALQWHNPGQANSLIGNVQAKFDIQGIARFTDLSVRKASIYQGLQNRNYRIRFTSDALQIDSFTFQISPAEWSGLFIPDSRQPIASIAANPLLIQPAVCLVDRFLNLIQQLQPVSVSAMLFGGPRNAILIVCTGSNSCDAICFNGACNYGSIVKNAVDSVAQFESLAITQTYDHFELVFSTSNFNVTSKPFAILAGNIVALMISNISAVSSADAPLVLQPILTVTDRKGNIVDMPSDSEIQYELRTRSGYIPIPGIPTPDAIPSSICVKRTQDPSMFSLESVIENSTAIITQGAAVFTSLTVRRAMSGYTLNFRLTSALRIFSANSTIFSVSPGVAIGICAISLPSLCAVLAPCHQKASIVCIDKYDNVQPSCNRCPAAECELSTFINTSVFENDVCPSGKICVKLSSGPYGAGLFRYGGGGQSMINCGSQICSAPFVIVESLVQISNGGASFTDLVMNVTSLNYTLTFFTYTTDPITLAVEEWTYTTPFIIVHPPPPIVQEVKFAPSMTQIQVIFNEDTNMNIKLGQLESTSCISEIDPSFLDAIGINPFCTWPKPSEFLISLGNGAYVNTSTRFFLNSNARILAKPIGNIGYAELLALQDILLPSTTVEGAISAGETIGKYFPALPTNLPTPSPKIIFADVLSACDLFQADARSSTGDAKRPFQSVNWGLNFTASRFENGVLQSGRTTRLFKTRIQFSSTLPNEMNSVIVTLMFNAPVLPGTILIISGMPGYVKALQISTLYPVLDPVNSVCFDGKGTCVEIPLLGPSAQLFTRSAAQWFLETSDLIVQVNGTSFLPPLKDIVFMFSMQNPAYFVPPSLVSISSKQGNGTGICLDPESVTCFRNLWYTFPRQQMETNCDRLCSQAAIFEIADRPITLVSGDVSETSKVNGVLNVITIRFSASEDLPPGALVIIGGFHSIKSPSSYICLSGPGALKFGCLPCQRKILPECPGHDLFSPIGVMDSISGEISFVVKAGAKIIASSTTEISFALINPAETNRARCSGTRPDLLVDQTICPSLATLTVRFLLSSTSTMAGQPSPLTGDVLGGGVFPKIVVASVSESNTFSGVLNYLHIEFVSNIDLPPQTVITISGFTALDTVQQFAILFHSRDCLITTSGQIQTSYQGQYSLTIAIPQMCQILANNVTIFDVQLKNPNLPVPPQILSLSASYAGCLGCAAGCGCEMTNLAGFLLQSHTVDNGIVMSGASSISISSHLNYVLTNIPGQSNILTMSVKCSAALKQQSNISVFGLVGLLDSFVDVLLTNGSIYRVRASTGKQTIKFTAPIQLSLGSPLVFNVSLQNAMQPQNWSSVGIAVNAAILVCDGPDFCVRLRERGASQYSMFSSQVAPISIDTEIPEGTPLLYSTSIRGLTSVAGAWNILTVALSANFVIQGPGYINVTGMDNFLLPAPATSFSLKTDLFNFQRPGSTHLFPNCSCNGDLENFPVDCSGCTNADQTFGIWQPDKLFGDPAFGIAKGRWGNGRLSVMIQKGVAIPAGREIIFSFLVLNPSASVFAQSNISLLCAPNFFVPSRLIMKNSVQVVGAQRPSFVLLTLRQTSNVAGDINRITVQFAVNCPLVSFSAISITLSGFQGFQTRSGYIPLSGPHAFMVAKKAAGNWSRETGQLVLIAGALVNRCPVADGFYSCPISAATDPTVSGLIVYQFSFYLQNPSQQNNGGYPVQIEAKTKEIYIPSALNTIGLFQTPVLGAMTRVPEFSSTMITESRKIQAVSNNIVVRFAVSVALYPSSLVSLNGFENSLSPDGLLSIIGANASAFAGAHFNSGTILLTVATKVDPGVMIEFSFSLYNSKIPQMGKTPSISALAVGKPVCDDAIVIDCSDFVSSYLNSNAYIPVDQTRFNVVDFFSASISPSFVVRSMTESNNVNFAINTVNVILVSNVLIPVSSDITISGLFPSSKWTIQDSRVNLIGYSADTFVTDSKPGIGRLISCNDQNSFKNDFDPLMCKLTNSERKLILSLRLPILPLVNISFSFKMPNGHNLCCSNTCDANCFAFESTVYASGKKSGSEPYLEISDSKFDTRIFGAGGKLSWIVKHVHESTGVVNAINKITFTIRPNAPLYPGTQISISGLNLTKQKSCVKCNFPTDMFGDNIPGLGCSDTTRSRCRSQVLCDSAGDPDDERCSPIFQANPEFQNMVYYPCLPIFSSDILESSVFAIPTSFRKGVLSATIDVGQKISEVEDTVFSVFLRNADVRKGYGAEYQCLSGESPGISCGSKLLPGISIITSSAKLCDENQEQDTSESCNKGDWNCAFTGTGTSKVRVCTSNYVQGVPDIGTASPAIDGHGNTLRDPCPTCMRQSDLVDFDRTLQGINSLQIQQLRSGMQNRESVPTLVEGGLTYGQYTIYLQLYNWVGIQNTVGRSFIQLGREDFSSYEIDGIGGAMGDEVVMPTAVIESSKEINIYSDQSVQLNCRGVLATCLNVNSVNNLLFSWSKANSSIVLGKQATFIIPRYYLNASQVEEFSCQVRQGSLLSMRSSVSIQTNLRMLEARISGVADGGQVWLKRNVLISARLSFDPEYLTTGLINSLTDFNYEWECKWLPVSTLDFVSCEDTVLANNSGADVLFDSGQFSEGDKVRITLLASRASGRFKKIGDAEDIVTFTLRDSETVNILAVQCDPNIGFLSLCTQKVGSISNVNDPIILEAILPVRLSGQEITAYNWSIPDPYDGIISTAMTLTPLTESVLIIRPGALIPGKQIKFSVSVRDNFEFSGTAEVSVIVRIPPFGGGVFVSPVNGTSMITSFDLDAFGWNADESSLPLSFSFSVSYQTEMVISNTMIMTISSILPPGDLNNKYEQIVLLDVTDLFGGTTRSATSLVVMPYPNPSVSFIQPKFISFYYPALNSGNSFQAFSAVGAVLGVMNILNVSCMASIGDGVGECMNADECCQRRKFRSYLLQRLEEVSLSLPISIASVQNQASVLVGLTSRAGEADFNLVVSCSQFLSSSISSAMEVANIGNTDITKIYALILDQLFASVASITIGARRDFHVRSLNNPDYYTRNLIWSLIQEISLVSSLSVKDSKPAQIPYLFSTASMIVYTVRIYLNQNAQDLSIQINGTDLTAKIPKAFFGTVDSSYEAVDIMLAISYLSSNLLPESFGPFIVLEARIGNPGEEFVSFNPASTKWGSIEMNLPYDSRISDLKQFETIDKQTGLKRILYGEVFDNYLWTWKTAQGIKKVAEGPGRFVTIDTNIFGYFSLVSSFQGCDGIDLSTSVYDGCGICGGDNSTCSGCDGIPKSGRSKNCSGHGSCDRGICSCNATWFGTMCDILCRDEIHCSGHGICLGTTCTCVTGYSNTNASYPGPFCSKFSTSDSSSGTSSDGVQSDDSAKRTLLFIVVPAIGGCLICCFLSGLLYTRRAGKVKKLKGNILEFPQPQLSIPAEKRQHEIIMIPDETGWSNVEYVAGNLNPVDEKKWKPRNLNESNAEERLKASAAFSYGPNSGQLVSAIAASTRASVCEMSTDVIERRVRNMQNQIRSKQTVLKYKDLGPKEMKKDHSDSSEDEIQLQDNNFTGKIVMLDQVTSNPEWLVPRSEIRPPRPQNSGRH